MFTVRLPLAKSAIPSARDLKSFNMTLRSLISSFLIDLAVVIKYNMFRNPKKRPTHMRDRVRIDKNLSDDFRFIIWTIRPDKMKAIYKNLMMLIEILLICCFVILTVFSLVQSKFIGIKVDNNLLYNKKIIRI